MIFNERQYKITGKQLTELRLILDRPEGTKEPAWLAKARKDALASQISDLKSELTEYDLIKKGKIHYLEDSDLTRLPMALIAARIANGLSQRNLAERLGMPAQQVQRYEATNYMGASLARLAEVAQTLGVRVRETWGEQHSKGGDVIFSWMGTSNIDWTRFPIREMVRRGWLTLKHGMSPAENIKEYFSQAAGPEFVSVFHRKKFHGENRPDEYGLLAWQARIIEKARREIAEGPVQTFSFTDTWLTDLVKCSASDNGPLVAKSMLAQHGIVLVIEQHLESTYLDGAAMLLPSGQPIVALTLRHDRLDNFWFVLMHELAHVYLHLFDSLHLDFFDDESCGEDDQIEREADSYALNVLIPDCAWDSCLSRFRMTKEMVQIDAERLGIHPSIIAGRIRKENSRFNILNDLVGQGNVRRLFGEL